jgi:hypothetical protein
LTRAGFRLLRFRSPLLTESLFLRVLRCFSSPGALYPAYVFSRECLDITPDGLPHSDTAGSSFASNSPTLFAGSRVLPRRLVPRHPPRTLSSLSCLRPLFNTRWELRSPHEPPSCSSILPAPCGEVGEGSGQASSLRLLCGSKTKPWPIRAMASLDENSRTS